MKQITNIYILVDISFRNGRNKERLQTILNKYAKITKWQCKYCQHTITKTAGHIPPRTKCPARRPNGLHSWVTKP